MAREAALREIAADRLRRSLAFNKSFTCTDAKIGGTVRPKKALRQRGAGRWRGPALVWDIDETGVPAKFQSQSFKVALFCARKGGGEKDVGGAVLDFFQASFRQIGADLGSQLRQVGVAEDLEADREVWDSLLSKSAP